MKRFLIIATLGLTGCVDPYAHCNGDQRCKAQVDQQAMEVWGAIFAAGAGAYEQSLAQQNAYNRGSLTTVQQGGTTTVYDGYGPIWRGY